MSKIKSFGEQFPSPTSVPVRNVFSARNRKPDSNGYNPIEVYFSLTTRPEVVG